MTSNCVWSDDVVALEVWCRLAVLAFNTENHALVMECGKKALEVHQENKKKDKGNSNRPRLVELARFRLVRGEVGRTVLKLNCPILFHTRFGTPGLV